MKAIKERPRRVQFGVLGMLLVVVSGYGTIAKGQDFTLVDTTPLMRFGPVDPVTGYPIWAEDAAGNIAELCFDTTLIPDPLAPNDPAAACPVCIDPALDLPDPLSPISFPDNFPEEAFYMAATSIMDTSNGGQALLVLALEAAFDGLGTVQDGEQIVFSRLRVRIDNATNMEPYTITHPYGVVTVVAEGTGARNINMSNDIFLWKEALGGDLSGRVGNFGTFLSSDTVSIGPGFFGDPCVDGPVSGSPFGTNFFRIEGLNIGEIGSDFLCTDANGIVTPTAGGPDDLSTTDCIETDHFTVIGKGASRFGVEVPRATYNRSTAAGANSTQINVWASSVENQNIELNIPGIIDPFPMCGDGTGQYFAHGLMSSSFIPPSTVTVTNLSDDPPTSVTHALSANLQIISASVDLAAGSLSIAASVADPDQGGASLSTGGFVLTTDPADPTIGTADITLAAGVCGIVPPVSISIDSAQGGTVSSLTTIIGAVPDVIAAAGGTMVVPTGAVATLDGTGSVGSELTYSWVQTGGGNISLDPLWDPTSATPSFTFPSTNDLLTFVLTVTDLNGISGSDTAIVTNTVVAVAGADQDLVTYPDTGVAIDGSASPGCRAQLQLGASHDGHGRCDTVRRGGSR